MERLWNKNYWKVMTANFSMWFAFYLLTPLLPLYLSEQFGATKDVIGVVLSGYSIAALLVRPFSGYLVDRFARKRVLLIFLALNAIAFSGYLAAGTLVWFALVRTLHGAPFGGATVANSTMAIDVLPASRRNEGMGYYGLGNNLATAIAPTVGVAVYQSTDSFDLLFWMALLFALIGLFIDASLKVPVSTPPATDIPGTVTTPRRWRKIRRFFLLRGWAVGLNMLFFGLCYGVLSNYLAIYGKEVMGMTSGTAGFFMLLAGGLMLSRLVGARQLRKGRLIQNATEGILISSVGYALFVLFPNSVGYYGSALLIGLGNGHLWPAFLNMMIGMAHENERGTANSTLLIAWDMGMGLGILYGGAIAEFFSYATAFWSVVGFHLVGAALFFAVTRHSYLRHRLPE